jgi:hypothetical protein
MTTASDAALMDRLRDRLRGVVQEVLAPGVTANCLIWGLSEVAYELTAASLSPPSGAVTTALNSFWTAARGAC